MKLGEISEIKIGLVLVRKKAKTKYQIENKYKLITLKNIEDNGAFNNEPFEEFESKDQLDSGYFTEEGDILIKLSNPYTTVYIDKSKKGLLVPSYFAIIKIKDENYIPKYISWYINSSKVKRELIRSQSGTTMSTTNKTILASLEIPNISKEDQEKIEKLQELYLKENYLLNRLIEEKEKYYKAITDKLLN